MNEKRRKFIALSAENLMHEMKKKSRESIKVAKQEPKSSMRWTTNVGQKSRSCLSIKAGIDEKEREDHRLEFFVDRDHQPIFVYLSSLLNQLFFHVLFYPVCV